MEHQASVGVFISLGITVELIVSCEMFVAFWVIVDIVFSITMVESLGYDGGFACGIKNGGKNCIFVYCHNKHILSDFL